MCDKSKQKPGCSKSLETFWGNLIKYLHCLARVARLCQRISLSAGVGKSQSDFDMSYFGTITGRQNSSKEGLTNLVY